MSSSFQHGLCAVPFLLPVILGRDVASVRPILIEEQALTTFTAGPYPCCRVYIPDPIVYRSIQVRLQSWRFYSTRVRKGVLGQYLFVSELDCYRTRSIVIRSSEFPTSTSGWSSYGGQNILRKSRKRRRPSCRFWTKQKK